jgi:hypothetical protein
MMGRCGDAAADFDKAQALGGLDDAASIEQGLAEAALCRTSAEEAERLMEGGHWGAARQRLDVAVALTEAAPDLLLRRARCQYEMGDFYAAAADTGRALKVGRVCFGWVGLGCGVCQGWWRWYRIDRTKPNQAKRKKG